MSTNTREETQKIYSLMKKLRADHTREVDTQEIKGTWHTIEYCVTCSDYEDIPDWPCPTILMLDHYEALLELVAHLRPEVLEFAGEMEDKLRKHDGDRQGWNLGPSDTLYPLHTSLKDHVDKLNFVAVISRLSRRSSQPDTPESLEAIISSSADVANFAMMIADNARRWKELLKERQGDEADT
jgi:hypothetical protein